MYRHSEHLDLLISFELLASNTSVVVSIKKTLINKQTIAQDSILSHLRPILPNTRTTVHVGSRRSRLTCRIVCYHSKLLMISPRSQAGSEDFHDDQPEQKRGKSISFSAYKLCKAHKDWSRDVVHTVYSPPRSVPVTLSARTSPQVLT